MATEIQVSLTLTGEGVDPVEVSSYVGLTPTKTWRHGEQIFESRLRWKHDGWSFSLGRKQSLDLGEEIRLLFDAIRHHAKEIRQAINRFNLDAEIACVVYAADDVPSMHLDSYLMRTIIDLGAEIDIDLYVLPSDRGETTASL